jgi:hypothetical protein
LGLLVALQMVGALASRAVNAEVPKAPASEPARPIRLYIDGELQLRYQAQTKFLLEPTPTRARRLYWDSMGQGQFASYWLRLTPRLDFGNGVVLVTQGDVRPDRVLGDGSRDVLPDRYDRSPNGELGVFRPRWAYADLNMQDAHIRIGQQSMHWGMGLVFNDGDHETVFGDYRGGALYERLAIETRPIGPHGVVLGYAQDVVFEDDAARLLDGDRAVTATGYAQWSDAVTSLGALANYRTQDAGHSALIAYADKLNRATFDLAGRTRRSLPELDGTFYVETELALQAGSARSRAVDADDRTTQTLLAFGGAIRVGLALGKDQEPTRFGCARDPTCMQSLTPHGRATIELEYGYASGDDTPYDGDFHRFTFDPNHHVGLVLFDELVRWQSARSAQSAVDKNLDAPKRPPASPDIYPTNGGVSGAHYIYPTLRYRPVPALALSAGALVAQATADQVDPYLTTTTGLRQNAHHGDPTRRDLGVEIDTGIEGRVRLGFGSYLTIGAQGGVLFPGDAFADATGGTVKTTWLGVGRVGYVF